MWRVPKLDQEYLHFLDDFMMRIPDEMDISIDIGNTGMMTWAPGVTRPIVCLGLSFCGDIEKGEAALRPLRCFRNPIADTVRVMPYYESQRIYRSSPLDEFRVDGRFGGDRRRLHPANWRRSYRCDCRGYRGSS